ncbi:MAG TPA: prephenate dehydrogenase/arogenate dehydrogenase family protein [Candidatus Omnitrophota bacterium]|nr:prephenate dehydrogenase/arogenate dehydrogenase family protein [Candidatus Omnitrophota bacterium]
MKQFKQITIIGVGLLGGSIGSAVKKKKLAGKVVGFFRNKKKIGPAIKLGLIDSGTDDFNQAVNGSDLIILCSPVNDIILKLKKIKSQGLTNVLITDTGSSKQEIIKAAKGLNFAGSHPLAGSEQSGAKFAKNNLFEGTVCVVSKEADSRSLKQIIRFWNALGSRTLVMSAKEHDRILAFTSHLPHIAAFSLINSIPKGKMSLSAGGLKDTTRIALSNPQVWVDIFLSNKANVLTSISAFEKSISSLKKAVSRGDRKKLLSFLKDAQSKRNSITHP